MIAHRDLYQCSRIFYIELSEHILAVRIDRGGRQEELHCDLLVGKPFGDKLQDLFFPFGQYG